MNPGLRSVAVLVVFSLLAAPTALAQIDNPDDPTPTTLYFHIFDPFAKFVVNTQPYNASFFDVGGVVFPANPATGWDFNTVYGYSTAGPVEYDFIEGGKPRFHPERGIAADVQISDSQQPTAYLYVDPRGLEGGYEHIPVHAPMTFRMQIREGDDLGSDFNQGETIMSGEFTAYLVGSRYCPLHTFNVVTGGLVYFTSCGGVVVDPIYGTGPAPGTGLYDQAPDTAPDGTPILYVDENHVIEIPIPLEIAGDGVIPKEEAYNIRFDWYQTFEGATEPDETQVNNLRLVLSPEYLPRLEMAIENPVYIEFIHPQVAAGTLLIHAGVNSPWGTYDVDVDNITVSVDGPAQPESLQQVVAQNQHVHGLHDKAAELTYLWKFRDEGAPNGEYTINMEVPNAAGNAVATGTAKFTIEGKKAFGTDDTGEVVPESNVDSDESNGAPGVGALPLLLPLGALALLRRRRL